MIGIETPADCEVVVVGAGQAGLAMGYFLARQGRRFAILDAANSVGSAWRNTTRQVSKEAAHIAERIAGRIAGRERPRGDADQPHASEEPRHVDP